MGRIAIVSLGAVLGIVAAACGSDDDKSPPVDSEGGAAGTPGSSGGTTAGGATTGGATATGGSGGTQSGGVGGEVGTGGAEPGGAGGEVVTGGAPSGGAGGETAGGNAGTAGDTAGGAGSGGAPGGAAGDAGGAGAPSGAGGETAGGSAGAPGGAAGTAGSVGVPGGAAGAAGSAGAPGGQAGAAGAAGEAGGGGVGPGNSVVPLYPTAGALWNDYVKNDGTSRYDATDTACAWQDGIVAKDSCFHAGEIRVYAPPTLTSCTGVAATDSEDAFDWICDDSTGSVRIISTGLLDGRYLSDLIDWTAATPAWKPMTVTATNGTISDTSDSSEWWTNPVVVDNDGGQLTDQSAIVVVTSPSPGGNYSVRADKVAVVSQPGVTMPGADSAGAAVIDIQDWHFSWIEGAIDATGDEFGLAMIAGGSNFAVVRGFSVDGANSQGIWALAPNGKFIDITATNNGGYGLQPMGSYVELRNITTTGNDRGISYGAGEGVLIENVTAIDNASDGVLTGASYSVFRHIVIANSGQHGFDTGDGNLVYDVVVYNCGGDGIRITGSWNTVAHVQVSNAGERAVILGGDNLLVDATLHNVGNMGIQDQPGDIVAATTVANSLARGMGLRAYGPPLMNLVMNTAVINNGGGIVTEADGGHYVFIDVASTDNTSPSFPDVHIDTNVTQATFSGNLIVTAGATSCDSPYGVGIDENCVPQAPSDATLTEGSVAGAFVGAPAADSTNASGATGTELFESITDWTEYDRPRRGWGIGGASLPDTGLRGACGPGQTCQIYDLNLTSAAASALREAVTLPTGDDVVTHNFSSDETNCGRFPGAAWVNTSCQITFLRSAYERIGDGIGNENGLCESNETCVFMPNIGAYQGHGNLIPASTIGAGGVIENVELLRYESNGY